MPLSRRSLFTAIAVGALSAIVTRDRVHAAQSSPATPWPAGLRAGFVAGVERNFEASSVRLSGPLALAVGAYEFTAPTAAAEAFPGLTRLYRDRIAAGGEHREASLPRLGEDDVAFVGEAPTDDPDTNLAVALIGWREAEVIFIAGAAGLGGDQLAPLITVAESITGRTIGDTEVVTPASSGEMHTGGLWDLLPTLDDLPSGFVLASEETLLGSGSTERSPANDPGGRATPIP